MRRPEAPPICLPQRLRAARHGPSFGGETLRKANCDAMGFYPACRGKCLPILTFMLQGLNVEPNPLTAEAEAEHIPIIIYVYEWLAGVDKPAGMLSVPGKGEACSVQTWARKQFPSATGPLVVHRLIWRPPAYCLLRRTRKTIRTYKHSSRIRQSASDTSPSSTVARGT